MISHPTLTLKSLNSHKTVPRVSREFRKKIDRYNGSTLQCMVQPSNMSYKRRVNPWCWFPLKCYCEDHINGLTRKRCNSSAVAIHQLLCLHQESMGRRLWRPSRVRALRSSLDLHPTTEEFLEPPQTPGRGWWGKPGPQFNIKMSSYQHRKFQYGDKTILWPSYLHNGISYTGKMPSLYWIRTQFSRSHLPCGLLTQLRAAAARWLTPYNGMWPPQRCWQQHCGEYRAAAGDPGPPGEVGEQLAPTSQWSAGSSRSHPEPASTLQALNNKAIKLFTYFSVDSFKAQKAGGLVHRWAFVVGGLLQLHPKGPVALDQNFQSPIHVGSHLVPPTRVGVTHPIPSNLNVSSSCFFFLGALW